MAQELVLGVDFDITKAEAKQKKLEERWSQANRKVEEQRVAIQNIESEIEKVKRHNADYEAQLDKVDGKLQMIEQKYAEMSELERAQSGDELLAKKDNLLAKQKELIGLITEGETAEKKYTDQLKKANERAEELETKLREVGYELAANNAGASETAESTKKAAKGTNGIATAFEKIGKRVSGLVKNVLIFQVVTKALQAIRTQLSNIMLADSKIKKQWDQLKGNLSVIGTTLLEPIKPYIEWILQKMVTLSNIIANVLSKLIGKSVNDMARLAKNTAKAGAEAKKATAGFDTLQTASNGNSGNSSDEVDTSGIEAISEESMSLVQKMMVILGAAALVIGFILCATGVNIPLGVALIAIGALSIAAAVALNWDSMSTEMQTIILILTAIVSAALLVLGALLLFSGTNIPLGLGLIVVGAIGLAKTLVPIWDSMSTEMQAIILTLTAIVSVALIVLGAVLLFSGTNIPLGLALLVGGIIAAGLIGNKLKERWDKLPNDVKETIYGIAAIVGAAMIVIGVILCCTSVGIPVGIALIIAGLATTIAAVSMSDDIISAIGSVLDKIGKKFSEFLDKYKDKFKSFLNWIIDKLNALIDGLNWLITPIREVICGIMNLAGQDVSIDDITIPHIPKLATGAVLPGGKPFAAIVGDQPAGQTNVEAPLDTIKQALAEVIAEMNPNFTIEATGSMAQLIRLLRLEIKKEDRRATVW